MQLADIVPLDRIEASLGQSLQVKKVNGSDWRELLAQTPPKTLGIAMHAWHRLVQSGKPKVDPMMMRAFFEKQDPELAGAIERLIGRPLVQDFGFMKATIQYKGKRFLVATSCAAQLYSGELHFYDIALADPRYPIAKKFRRSPHQHHRGFGLLPTVVENVRACALERDCPAVTLTAAHPRLVPLFERYGFAVEDSELARGAMASGGGVPMVSTTGIRTT